MRREAKGLLAQVEEGALDSRVPLADVLRRCIALGGRAGSAELRDWARQELDGYDASNADVPPYRLISAPLLADGFQGHYMFKRKQLSPTDLPEFAREDMSGPIRIPFGIGEIEKLAVKSKATGIQQSGSDILASFMNRSGKYNASFERIYYDIGPHAFGGILDSVRTKLTAMVAELHAAGVSSDEIPSRAAADEAVQVVIHGARRSPITINAVSAGPGAVAHAGNIEHQTTSSVPDWVKGPWAALLGLATLAGTYAAFAAGLNWPPF